MIASGALAFGNAVLCVLNLLERELQQRRMSANPPSAAQVHTLLGRISLVTHFQTIGLIAFVVVALVWGSKRRTRARVARDGENFVEPHLRTVWPNGYYVTFLFGALSILATILATSTRHTGMNVADVVSYRGYLAVSHLFRVALWSTNIALVYRAIQLQDRREAATAAAFTVAQFTGEGVGTPPPGL
jgi:hypothetical protein